MSAQSTQPINLCWFCEYFIYSKATEDWSEDTPGSDFSLACGKGHWEFDVFNTTQAQFAAILSTALTCKDFVLLDSVKLAREGH
jgi:hypothetical protein